MNGILAATLMVGGTGLLIGILLGIAGKKFYVEVDERETKVREALPGNNCGGCGYPGCDGAAAAVVKGEAPVSVCPVGGAPVAAAVGAIMGQKADVQERKKAVVRCAGTVSYTHLDVYKRQVRILTGTLVEAGMGKRDIVSMTELLKAKNRESAGFLAPACGLLLKEVRYE